LAKLSATKTGTSHQNKKEEQSQRAMMLMQVCQNFGQKSGPPHHKRRISTIATIKAVDGSWQTFRQQNGPIAQQEKKKNNRNEQGC